MSLGVLSRGGAKRRPGLGAYQSKIPAECWDTPGFKDCHVKQYAASMKACADAGIPDDPDCIGAGTDSRDAQYCSCKKPATTKKPTVTTTTVTPATPDEGFETEATILGLPMKSVAMVALVGVGLYLFTTKKG